MADTDQDLTGLGGSFLDSAYGPDSVATGDVLKHYYGVGNPDPNDPHPAELRNATVVPGTLKGWINQHVPQSPRAVQDFFTSKETEPFWTASQFLTHAPTAPAAFISAIGAGRIRHPDDWGGTGRLAAALATPEWSGRLSPEELTQLWEQFGWVPGNRAWGMSSSRPTATAGPATATSLKDLQLTPEAEAQLSEPGSRRTRWDAEGTLPTLLSGNDLERLFSAEPRLRDLMTQLQINKRMLTQGATKGSGSPIDRFSPDLGYAQITPRSLEARAPSIPELLDTMRHELTHATANFQGLPGGGSRLTKPVSGTHAQQVLDARAQEMQKIYEDAYRAYHDPVKQQQTSREFLESGAVNQKRNEQYNNLKDILARTREAYDLARGVPSMAGYLHAPWERMAREGQLSGHLAEDEQHKMAPGVVDTYQPNAHVNEAEFKKIWHVPLKMFEPPKP